MGANVAALETAGLVAGAPDPEDGRQTIWSLTETCREWIKTSRAAKRDWLLHAIQSSLTPEQQEQLPNAIALLKRLIP
jgi:DNA-binding MarR family transcriptional regulator